MIATFAAELVALSGVFHQCPSHKVATLVLDLILEARRGGEDPLALSAAGAHALTWFEENLPVPGLLETLRREGVILPGPIVSPTESARAERLAEIETAEVGITGAEAALADVGGIVVRSGPGRGRLASLLPPTHIALITPDQLYPSLFDWMESLRAAGRLESVFAGVSNLTVIAGPSRTADIEKTLVLGVHGPRVLHVICVEGEA
ncbi:MAG: LUD domain-containing protein [Chloroflexi bacterium]|nr:LUD domain-containing protein [Chloroflexota bacterium]